MAITSAKGAKGTAFIGFSYILKKLLFLLGYSCSVVSVLLVSAVQQSEFAVCLHMSPLLGIFFPFESPQSTELSFHCF